ENDSTLVRLLRIVMPEKMLGVTTSMACFRGFAMTFILVAVYGCGGEAEHKNVCPIDGAPPEWSKPMSDNNCEYFHFSSIERHTHSWTAPCEKATLHLSDPRF